MLPPLSTVVCRCCLSAGHSNYKVRCSLCRWLEWTQSNSGRFANLCPDVSSTSLFSLCLVGHSCDSQAFLRRHTSKQKRGFLLLCNQTFTISMCRKPPIRDLIPDLFSSPCLNLLIRHFQLINVYFTSNPKWTGLICLLLTLPVTHSTFIFEYKSIHSFNLSSSNKSVWAHCLCHAIPPT